MSFRVTTVQKPPAIFFFEFQEIHRPFSTKTSQTMGAKKSLDQVSSGATRDVAAKL